MPLLLICFKTSGHAAACTFLYSSTHSGFNFMICAILFPGLIVLLSRSEGLQDVTEEDVGDAGTEATESTVYSDERWVCVFLLEENEKVLVAEQLGEVQLSQLASGAVQRPWLERSALRASAGKWDMLEVIVSSVIV